MAKNSEKEGEGEGEELPAPAESVSVLKKLKKWGDYASIGEPVGKFIPCKTPLSKDLLTSVLLPEPPKNALTLDSLLLSQRDQGRRIGFIIDLSNHPCLYENDIKSYKDVKYHHVRLVAKVVPPPDFVAEVRRVAEAFMAEHPDEHIAIHCAYGFNRTGFVVCACLIELYGLTVSQALEAFAAARPPGVKHEAFMDELYRRYGQDGRLPSTLQQQQQQQTVHDSSCHSQPAIASSLATDEPLSASGTQGAQGVPSAAAPSPPSHLPLVHSSPELLAGSSSCAALIQQPQPQQQQEQEQQQPSCTPHPLAQPPPTQSEPQQPMPSPPQITTTTTAASPAKPPTLLNFFHRHLKLPLHSPTPPTKHTFPSALRKPTHSRTHSTNQPPRSSPPPSPSASFTAQQSARPWDHSAPQSPSPHHHAQETRTVPLSTAAIQQWCAQASKSPLYSAFRSNAASEITSMAGSVDDWVSQSHSQQGGGYEASCGLPAAGVHHNQHVGGDAHPAVLPSLNEEVDDANADSPVAPLPRNAGDVDEACTGAGAQQQQKVSEAERVPSNASSIGNWLDAYLDQQVTLSRAGTLAADPVIPPPEDGQS